MNDQNLGKCAKPRCLQQRILFSNHCGKHTPNARPRRCTCPCTCGAQGPAQAAGAN